MLLVKTYISSSDLQGIGLFAGQDIKKGTVTWRYNPDFDRSFTVEKVKRMPNLLQKFIIKYASLSTQSNTYILCGDDARFTNHSINANLDAVRIKGELELVAVANKNIKKGEELTINYRQIDRVDAVSKEEYLNFSK